MKKSTMLGLLLLSVILSGCGNSSNKPSESELLIQETSAVKIYTENTNAYSETLLERTEPILSSQILTQYIDNELKPEIEKITFKTICSGDIREKVYCKDLYNINVLHSGVVGLTGVPVEIDFDSEIRKGELTFYYNKDELRGIPEENLIFLHYLENENYYETIMDFRRDIDNSTMTISIREPGVYLLADAYQWFEVWGMDTNGYEYDRKESDYISDWERECNTGDIMEIADIKWAESNAPIFNVSTPEQLAGAVYYVNTNIEYGDYTLCLENDIDLFGYEWAPMGWRKNGFHGTIDGMGHTISNLKISNAGEYSTGFIGNGIYYTEIKNLNITDAEIIGGRYAGILGGECYADECINVNVSGKITADSKYGAIIGCESGTYYENCTADVIINGEKYEYFSSNQKVQAETPVTEVFTLKVDSSNNVTRDEISGYDGLTWIILRDGKPILDRNAENELILDSQWTSGKRSGKYTVYLASFINGAYIRVSNIVEFDTDKNV